MSHFSFTYPSPLSQNPSQQTKIKINVVHMRGVIDLQSQRKEGKRKGKKEKGVGVDTVAHLFVEAEGLGWRFRMRRENEDLE